MDFFKFHRTHLIVIAVFLAFYFSFVSSEKIHSFVITTFDRNALASGNKRSATRKPVSFVANVLVTNLDKDNGKLSGVGQVGSHTAGDILYNERDFNIGDAVITDENGVVKTFDDLNGIKRVYLHGFNNKDGTFVIKKVVIQK